MCACNKHHHLGKKHQKGRPLKLRSDTFAPRDAFSPIVASGPNTITLHYSANRRQMRDGDIVYMDYGADYEYYNSDITRTWPVSGRFTPEQEKMYLCILEARDAIIAAM